jgi:polysaccharide export outer membrane protein
MYALTTHLLYRSFIFDQITHTQLGKLCMNIIKTSALAVLIAVTSACTIIPGSNMSPINSFFFDDTPEGITDAKADISYIPITPTLLRQLINEPTLAPTINPTLVNQLSEYEYAVGVGDVLAITVWEHPELTIPSGPFRSAASGGNEVKSDGTIFYPYVGSIAVAGLSVNEIKRLLETKLSSVIKSPQLDVKLAAFQSQKVYISGEVKKPSILPVTNIPLTLLDAITSAGGLTDSAAWENVTLSRGGALSTISLRSILENGRWSDNLLLQDGDLVHIPASDSQQVMILGEVVRPRSLQISRSGTSLAAALAQASGINEARADGRGIYVLRNTGSSISEDGTPLYTATVFHLNAASAIGFMYADNFPLQPRDIVYVSPAPITRWNRFLSTLLPSVIFTDKISDAERSLTN